MSHSFSRRQFMKTGTVAAAGYMVASGLPLKASRSPNERVSFASIGIGGKGAGDTADAARCGDLIAICDVDANRLAGSAQRYTNAKPFADYRELLDQMGDKLDAVTVSTPDHMHAPIGLKAMRQKLHCFCQKPLTRTIYESRLMGQVARENGLATQMGNQGTADDALRRSAHWLKNGAIGTVQELHVWTDRAKGWWPQGVDRPAPSPCPDHLDWDLWLGVAPERPHAEGYHSFKWRGWWDFGTGALGDIACHAVSLPFMGLDLRNPIAVEAETSGHNKDSFPEWSIITFEFAANDDRPALTLTWYDGGKLPDSALIGGREPGANGTLAIGDKGKLFGHSLIDGAEPVDVEFPHSPGHFDEWVAEIQGEGRAMSNFPDYAGPLTESMLMGNLAVWAGEKVEWDAENMKVTNDVAGCDSLIKPTYRDGHVLDV
jgi:predicted dehydrogenase